MGGWRTQRAAVIVVPREKAAPPIVGLRELQSRLAERHNLSRKSFTKKRMPRTGEPNVTAYVCTVGSITMVKVFLEG